MAMKEPPAVSIVILNYNSLNSLGNKVLNYLQSVLDTDYPNFEVLFVDNGSSDGSPELVEKAFSSAPRLRTVRLGANYGYAAGNNLGIKESNKDSEYVCILNFDVKVSREWLEPLVAIMEGDPSIGVAGCRVMAISDEGRVDSAGGYMDSLGMVYARRGIEEDISQPQEVFMVFGSAFMVRRYLFEDLGGFDNSFFLLCEDIDFCWRVWLQGYKVIYVASSAVYHDASASTSQLSSPFLFYHSFKNHLAMLIKNYQLHNLLIHAPMLLAIYLGQGLFLSLSGKPSYGWAYLKAPFWNLTHLPATWKKRHQVQSLRQRSDADLRKMKIIIKPRLWSKFRGHHYL